MQAEFAFHKHDLLFSEIIFTSSVLTATKLTFPYLNLKFLLYTNKNILVNLFLLFKFN